MYPEPEIAARLAQASVQDISHGGMGSILFLKPLSGGRRFGTVIASADCNDEDGIPVDIAVSLDDRGGLFELDFWKVDDSPLRKYPRPQQLREAGDAAPDPSESESTLASRRSPFRRRVSRIPYPVVPFKIGAA